MFSLLLALVVVSLAGTATSGLGGAEGGGVGGAVGRGVGVAPDGGMGGALDGGMGGATGGGDGAGWLEEAVGTEREKAEGWDIGEREMEHNNHCPLELYTAITSIHGTPVSQF